MMLAERFAGWGFCRVLFLLGLISVVACGRGSHSDDPGTAHPAPPGATAAGDEQHPEEESHDDIVRLDPEMLRDLRWTTAPVEVRAADEGVLVLGEIQVNAEAHAVVASPIAAQVLQLFVAEGATVRAGQDLAELSSPELGRARAALKTAQAQAELADKTLARKRWLLEERILPEREVEAAAAVADAAAAELVAARTVLAALGIDAEANAAVGALAAGRFRLRAPLAGSVLARSAVWGEMADPARPLFRIADLRRLWLVVHAFERDAVRIESGAVARVTFPALPGQTFSGTVIGVGTQVDSASRTIPVRLEIASEGVLRPGMSASAWIPLSRPQGSDPRAAASLLAVPAAALQRLQQGWCVFVPRDPNSFELRAVGRGRDLGGEVEILSGLAPGEQVVVDGAFLLRAEAEKARGGGAHHDH